MQAIDGIFYVIVLIMSMIVHEFSHGYVAYLLGDNTAKVNGRLTLNPLKHLDPFGSVVLPLLLIISKASFIIGWAKPVPYNPNNLRGGRRGVILVSIAGIVMNIFIAVLFGLLMRYATYFGIPAYAGDVTAIHPFYKIETIIVFTNLVLALFNLIPIPPLDGSKILFSFFPRSFQPINDFLERWGRVLIIIFIIFLWSKFTPLLYLTFSLITGIQ